MTMYILGKIIRRVKLNLKSYSFILLEVIIGMTILNLFITITNSVTERYEYLLASGLNKKYDISITGLYNNNELLKDLDYTTWLRESPTPYEDEDLIPFSYNDYKTLAEKYNDTIDVMLYLRKKILIQAADGSIKGGGNLIFVSDSFFEKLEHDKNCIIGSEFMDMLTKDNIYNKRDLIVYYDESDSQVKSYMGEYIKTVNVSEVDNSKLNSLINSWLGEDVALGDMCILPVEYYYDFFHPVDIPNYFNISISLKDSNSDIATIESSIMEIINYLYKTHDRYGYEIDSVLNMFLEKTNGIMKISKAVNVAAIISSIIVILGLTGILLLIVERRKKEFAVCISVGATKPIILMETIFEACTITVGGGIIGTILSLIILNMNIIKIEDVNISVSYFSIAMTLLLSLIIGCVATLIPVLKIKKLMPVEILRDL